MGNRKMEEIVSERYTVRIYLSLNIEGVRHDHKLAFILLSPRFHIFTVSINKMRKNLEEVVHE